ncbi:DUF2971 domain-containing protein [Moritella sp. F3]|uniref:DUF2971 domain-containing protein n=1 Tax=Moritella sp. F3 TaxID=2718882 RepID=UPI0018E12453|nr:DUF2971 domain-containing protein [Moritella sp. F3]GIC79346.1 hypothetical protein FMO001_40730 [Moritella sp. F1]GIC84065.1 hypothetical protein FMO003_43450 [Moritella sp. F3]
MEYPEVKYLYKFRSLSNGNDENGDIKYNQFTLSMLDNNTAWLAKPSTFNDPFDCNHRPIRSRMSPDDELFSKGVAPSYTEQKIMESLPEDATERDIETAIFKIAELRNDHIEFEINNYCILSLSEDCNHILMWSHYADDHKGICLIYDRKPNTLLSSDLCRPVRYRAVDYAISHHDFQSFFRNNGRGENWRETNNLLTNAMFTKSECWFYEKEWRLVNPFLQNAKGFNLNMDAKIKGVVFGCLTPEVDKKFIMERYGDKFQYYQAWKCKHDYRLETIPESEWVGRKKYYEEERDTSKFI